MLKRTDRYGDQRYYYDTESKKFYVSATTFCKKVLPENPYLVKWKQELGVFEANRRAKEAALYGILMHIIVEDFLGVENYDIKALLSTTYEFTEKHNKEGLRTMWIKNLKNDILAFAQFAFEREINPLHTERWCKKDVNKYGGIAGTIDLECMLKWNRGRRRSIVDFKSTRKGFYDGNRLQLALYKEVLDDPDLLLFNWAPTNWQTEPKYKFQNQTDHKVIKKLPHYIEIAIIEGMFEPKLKQLDFEVLSMGQQPVFRIRDLEELMEEDQ